MKLQHLLIALLGSICVTACSRSTDLTVINQSPAKLTKVVVSGSGFERSLGDLAPGAHQQVSVTPRGESDLKLAFDVNGQHFAQEKGYFENGYKVSATVSPGFTLTVDAQLPGY